MPTPHSIRAMVITCAMLLLISSCTKSPVTRQITARDRNPNCDTCPQAPLQIDEQVILYPQTSDWVYIGDNRYECDLERLLTGIGSPVDSFMISALYVGTARGAKQIRRGTAISFDSGSLAWFGFKLDFQPAPGNGAPQSMTVKLMLTRL